MAVIMLDLPQKSGEQIVINTETHRFDFEQGTNSTRLTIYDLTGPKGNDRARVGVFEYPSPKPTKDA